MADTLYPVTSGFYDAVDYDRLYTADQMNMPYKRVITEGVFATPQGTPSTDFQVIATTGLALSVLAGNALLGGKWIESGSAVQATAPANTAILPRIDSVILRADKNTAVRAANIVYRTGTAASNPSAPALETGSNVFELRLANISMPAGATNITQSFITDMRGSADCPWITSLIKQVDTSALFNQWAAAYEEKFAQMQSQWDDFFDQLTDELTITPNVTVMAHKYVVEDDYQNMIDLGTDFPNLNPETDVIMLFINGLYANEGRTSAGGKWYLDTSTTPYYIMLNNLYTTGQEFYVVVLKSIIANDVTSLNQLLAEVAYRIPEAPTANGTYTLKCISSNGSRSYQWVKD